ncbi:hypothetical protein FA95DRAFT_1193976 [Auriscalpium vulgare]|uniref:Uncharacterized protein n=1 Tax=Auriscalpium vulgare TaxID=40419 RepID=A0ACB8R427_9AGAM|nr:hypothetical protein FA95DRAFT_1193976 [Auriscalpium vulgare]
MLDQRLGLHRWEVCGTHGRMFGTLCLWLTLRTLATFWRRINAFDACEGAQDTRHCRRCQQLQAELLGPGRKVRHRHWHVEVYGIGLGKKTNERARRRQLISRKR